MSALVHDRFQRYAVISVGRKRSPERLVIAYSDEKTLRGLLAAPSIVSLGHRTLKEAMGSSDGCVQTDHTSQASAAVASVDRANRFLGRSGATRWLLQHVPDVGKHVVVIRDLLQYSFVAAFAFCYSKNLLSVTIRTLISS